MKYFEKLDTRIKTTYSTDYFSGDYNHEIYLMKANDDGSHRPKYYLRAVTNINGVEVIQGYLYFYIDYDTKTSEFIGIKVHEEFRDLNIGSLLGLIIFSKRVSNAPASLSFGIRNSSKSRFSFSFQLRSSVRLFSTSSSASKITRFFPPLADIVFILLVAFWRLSLPFVGTTKSFGIETPNT